ncbi:hypothetical protein PVAP13_8KG339004 [Panicum virgatum]|uniref:Uncharacterized protein n=1 Tax=Panicum virgatum TaxID=38727 RepID=A0A8T0PNZ2_PANVG|nr:hypothetical protein PVAP13_8KG339004 [Panicum virgatum]
MLDLLQCIFGFQMSRFGKSLHQRWDEDDESDDDDLLILAGLIEGSKRNKRKKNFRGSLPGRHSVQRGILGVMMVYSGTTSRTRAYTTTSISEGGSGCPSLSFSADRCCSGVSR